MFCTKCGQKFEGRFCPNCGTPAEQTAQQDLSIPTLKKPHYVDFGGESIDVNKVIRMYGFGIRKIGAYTYISEKTGVPVPSVKQILDPIIQHHQSAGETVGLLDGAKAQMSLEIPESREKPLTKHQRINENKKNGVACCPKCGSASLSANKKGFSFVKGAIGGGLGAVVAPVGIVMGLGAGNIGSKKLYVTCLSCGHRWKL